MAHKVVWSPEALEDIQGIADYIARDSRSYAAAVVQRHHISLGCDSAGKQEVNLSLLSAEALGPLPNHYCDGGRSWNR
jgi:hypothetical protein